MGPEGTSPGNTAPESLGANGMGADSAVAADS